MAALKKLKANTLLETIVALSIAMLSFTVGGYLYSRYLNFEKQSIKQKAIYKIDELIHDCYANRDFEEDEQKVGSFIILKKVEQDDKLYTVEFTIEDNRKKSIYRKTIYVYEEG